MKADIEINQINKFMYVTFTDIQLVIKHLCTFCAYILYLCKTNYYSLSFSGMLNSNNFFFQNTFYKIYSHGAIHFCKICITVS